MAKKKILGIFDKRPLIWFHYALLTGVVFLAHYVSDITGLEAIVLTKPALGWTLLAIWYFLWLSISDQLIHAILGVD